MTADKFVDEYLDLGEQHRCPYFLFVERCKAAGLEPRDVLREIRGRYGNGSSNPVTGVPAPWMNYVRMTMSDGSRPWAYDGFGFKDIQRRLPPLTEKIWPHLPYHGPLAKFPVPMTPHQIAGACRSRRVVMVREKDNVWIVRDVDPDYHEVLQQAKRLRYERKERMKRRLAYASNKKNSKPLPPFTQKIWPHLPFKGKVSDFPIRVSVHQLAGACKTGRIALIRYEEEILVVRHVDESYSDVVDLAKDRRVVDEYGNLRGRSERYELWQEFFTVFPKPAA
jgi:hypothetical protein